MDPKRIVRCASLAAAVCLVSGCASIGPSARGTWVSLRSEHFDLVSDTGEPDARIALRELETLFAAEVKLFFPGRGMRTRVQVVLLGSDADLKQILGESSGVTSRSVFGDPLIVAGISGLPHGRSGQDAQGVLAHELAHVLSGTVIGHKPLWLAEGLAGYAQTLHLDAAGRAVGGEAPQYLLATLGKTVPLRYAAQLQRGLETAQLPIPERMLFYASSWALVHWLIDERPVEFSDYVTRLARAEDPTTALRAALPGLEPADFDREVRDWHWRDQSLVLRVPIPPWDGAIAARPLLPAEVEATRAQLFLLSAALGDRKGQARARAASSAALGLDEGQPVAVRITSWLEHLLPERQVALGRRAVALHGDDARAHSVLASALASAKAPVGEVVAAAHRALDLEPDRPATLNTLAWAYATHGLSAEAVPTARKAVALAPANSHYLDTLAVALVGNGQCAEAAEMERRAIGFFPEIAASPHAAGASGPDVIGRARIGEFRARLANMERGCTVPLEFSGEERDSGNGAPGQREQPVRPPLQPRTTAQ